MDQHGWIKTDVMVPEVGIPVLCHQVIYGRSVGVMDELGVFRFDHPGDTLKPTHWMPLPELPLSEIPHDVLEDRLPNKSLEATADSAHL